MWSPLCPTSPPLCVSDGPCRLDWPPREQENENEMKLTDDKGGVTHRVLWDSLKKGFKRKFLPAGLAYPPNPPC